MSPGVARQRQRSERVSQMIIANRLTDGLVVFLSQNGGWSTDIEQGLVLDDPAEQEARLAAAKRDEDGCIVIDPTLIEVERADGRLRPTAIREAIRAFGPST